LESFTPLAPTKKNACNKAICIPLTKASIGEANASNKVTHTRSKGIGTKENPILLGTFHD
jgi:hypothetical protein